MNVPGWLIASLLLPVTASAHTGPVVSESGDSALEAAVGTRASDGVLRFAAAVAVAGDELLVGRSGFTARLTTSGGGVHVFRRASGVWQESSIIAPAKRAATDNFGAALAVDGTWLAVGAPGANEGRGAVYLFERSTAGRWVERAKVTAAASGAGDHFGTVVALRGGLLLVGAPERARERGAVAVFRRASAATWTERTMLTSADTNVYGLGRALAFAGDRIVIGAPGTEPYQGIGVPARPPSVSQVLIFRDSSGSWVREAQLTGPANTSGEQAQFGLTLLADSTELWVGDPTAGNGAVFQFRRDAKGVWNGAGQLAAVYDMRSFGAPLVRAGRDRMVGGNGDIAVFRYDSAASAWKEAQHLSLTDSSLAFPHYGDKPGWFPSTFVMAATADRAVIGMVWANLFEGAALALTRGTNGTWGADGTMADTAWNTQQPLTGSARACLRGQVKVFGCHNVDLLAFLPRAAIGGGGRDVVLTGIWGWTDTATSREFAIVGRSDGTSFVEVTKPTEPVYLGDLPYHKEGSPSEWRDMKVYKNHAFIVSEGGNHGMQVFDLTQLRSVKQPVVFQETAHYNKIAAAHTIIGDEQSGFMYAAGSNGGGETCGGGLHMIDVHTPTAPVFAGCYADSAGGGGRGYIHDAQCVVYHGPDKSYQGREICLNSNGSWVDIVDVTDKKQPKAISAAKYPNAGYTHQGWFTEDQRYFFVDDELDEFGVRDGTVRTRTIGFDLSHLDDPVLLTQFYGTTGATDHNLYIRDHLMYESNYTAGLRVIDIRDPAHPAEVGYFDTAPAFADSPRPGMPRMSQGTWSNYPYFKGGVVAVTSMGEGLYLVRYRSATPSR